MDSTTLRLVLFILGIAFVAGIYFWDRAKHVDSRLHNRQSRRKTKKHDHSVFDQTEHRKDAESVGQVDIEEEPDIEDLQFSAVSDTPDFDSELELSFASTDAFQEFEAGADLPTKILQVNLVARNSEISGLMILDLATELNMQLGEFDIFHRMDDKTGKSVFSMANMMEPGSFDADNMENFHSPGLTLFSQLPAPVDCLTVYSEMMNAAKRMSYILGAEMQDASRSVMTAQSIEHERESVVAYRQKLQLAMQAL